MRLGKNERAVLVEIDPEADWTPPSQYMAAFPWFQACPSGYVLNRLVAKGLVEIRYMHMTPDEHREGRRLRKPGRETAEHNAALRLTEIGKSFRTASLISAAADRDVRRLKLQKLFPTDLPDLDGDIPF